MMATILQDQMTLRGVNSLSPSDYEQIVELLIEQLRELELSLAARETTDKHARSSLMNERPRLAADFSTIRELAYGQ